MDDDDQDEQRYEVGRDPGVVEYFLILVLVAVVVIAGIVVYTTQ